MGCHRWSQALVQYIDEIWHFYSSHSDREFPLAGAGTGTGPGTRNREIT